MSISRFNKLLKTSGYFINIFYTSNQVIKVMYCNEGKPITMQQIRERYLNYCKAHNIPPEGEFFLTAQLPVFKVHK